VLAGAVLVLAAAATTVAVGALRPPAPAYAATPPPLRYESPAGGPSAGALLRRIADAAERSPVRGAGDYGYIHTKNWILANPNLAPRGAFLTVDPYEMWLWYRTADGSGRVVTDDPDTGRAESVQDPGTYKGYVCWTADSGSLPLVCPVDRLTDPRVLREVLLIDGQPETIDQTGRTSPLGGYMYLARDLILPPEVRAQAWRVLADLPGIEYTGRVRDRAGRTGEAFSLDFDASSGPVRDTLIVDPASGELLGYERTLLALTDPDFFAEFLPDAVPLKIRTPAVVAYTVFLDAELRPTDR
jgi:hypothetical protein